MSGFSLSINARLETWFQFILPPPPLYQREDKFTNANVHRYLHFNYASTIMNLHYNNTYYSRADTTATTTLYCIITRAACITMYKMADDSRLSLQHSIAAPSFLFPCVQRSAVLSYNYNVTADVLQRR